MKRALQSLVVLGFVSGVLVGKAVAQDTPRYALVVIRNTTDVTVNYFYWWGNESWYDGGSDRAGELTLAPGARHYYAWEYAAGEEGDSPPLRVFFNSYVVGARGAGGVPTEYALETNPSPAREKKYYKKYHFGLRSNNRLDLFETR